MDFLFININPCKGMLYACGGKKNPKGENTTSPQSPSDHDLMAHSASLLGGVSSKGIIKQTKSEIQKLKN